MTQTHVWLVSAVLVLGGCATPEREQALGQCRGEAVAQFPAVYQQRLVTRTQAVETLTGNTTCTTVNSGNVSTTNCVAEKRIQYVPYKVLETFDANKKSRDQAERACADRLCMQRYGNADCEK